MDRQELKEITANLKAKFKRFTGFSRIQKQNQKGMTLIEIMIVIVIIGGIMTMLMGRIFGAKDKANIRTTKLAINNLVEVLEKYNLDCNSYPSSLEGLLKKDECANWGPEAYVKNLPKDAWGNDFLYEKNGGSYTIRSLGKDGKEGGSGYDADITNDDAAK
jgi:general secretion pathway protein G